MFQKLSTNEMAHKYKKIFGVIKTSQYCSEKSTVPVTISL